MNVYELFMQLIAFGGALLFFAVPLSAFAAIVVLAVYRVKRARAHPVTPPPPPGAETQGVRATPADTREPRGILPVWQWLLLLFPIPAAFFAPNAIACYALVREFPEGTGKLSYWPDPFAVLPAAFLCTILVLLALKRSKVLLFAYVGGVAAMMLDLVWVQHALCYSHYVLNKWSSTEAVGVVFGDVGSSLWALAGVGAGWAVRTWISLAQGIAGPGQSNV